MSCTKIPNIISLSSTHWLSSFTHWLFPQSCFLCGDISTQVVCTACLADLPYQNAACIYCAKPLKSEKTNSEICYQCRKELPPYTHTQALFSYTYPVSTLIPAAKFQQNLAVLNLLGYLMAQFMILEPRPDVLIPVPLHPKRVRQRGYNQSLELAKCITKETGIPLDNKACKRIKNTAPQTSLTSSQQRQDNVKCAFQIINIKPHWQHIILIDDVMTTGSTVKELALEFKKAGAKRVDVWCCARR